MAQKWECLIEIPTLDGIQGYLNAMGGQDRELITVGNVGVEPAEPEVDAHTPLQFVFKRQKERIQASHSACPQKVTWI
jgi:hypothetical protein